MKANTTAQKQEIKLLITTTSGEKFEYSSSVWGDDPLKEVAWVREHGAFQTGRGHTNAIAIQQIDIISPKPTPKPPLEIPEVEILGEDELGEDEMRIVPY